MFLFDRTGVSRAVGGMASQFWFFGKQ